jgi:hypothetical protein
MVRGAVVVNLLVVFLGLLISFAEGEWYWPFSSPVVFVAYALAGALLGAAALGSVKALSRIS